MRLLHRMFRKRGFSAALILLVAGCSFENIERHTTRETHRSSADAKTTAPSRIDSFQGEYRFLSNFWPAVVDYEGISYPSVEHAYQSAKTLDRSERRRIAAIAEPGEAKRAGRALPNQRADWEQVKLRVMEDCVRYKFTRHADLREKLLATGTAELIEGNTWNDRFWGVCDGQGENHLGKILMKVRTELRREFHPEAQSPQS
jgi:ribA/ribD-fused uncharacterized protein